MGSHRAAVFASLNQIYVYTAKGLTERVSPCRYRHNPHRGRHTEREGGKGREGEAGDVKFAHTASHRCVDKLRRWMLLHPPRPF